MLRAAAKLRVAQPALSRQIRTLERQLGTPLLQRTRRGVGLTPAGTTLLDGIRFALPRLEAAIESARLADEGQLGTLRIALGRAALDSLAVGAAIARLRMRFPDIDLIVSELPAYHHAAALRAGDVDLGIGYSGENVAGIRSRPLFSDHINGALLAESHPLARQTTVTAEELRNEPLMVVESAMSLVPQVAHVLREAAIACDLRESLETVYSLVAAGHGWALACASQGVSAPAGTVIVPLRDIDVPVHMVARWRASNDSRLITNVVASLPSAADETKPGAAARTTPRRGTAWRAHDGGHSIPAELELSQLEALVVAIDEDSLSVAAQRLGLTQSGIARRIRKLEHAIGCPLLQRGLQHPLATPAGRVFRDQGRAVLDLMEAAVTRAARVGRGVLASCTIGSLPTELTSGILVSTIRQVADQFPSIAIEVREMLTNTQIDALRARRIDLAIAGSLAAQAEDPGIASVLLTEDPIECALVSASHRLATRAWLRVNDLTQDPFLFVSRESSPYLHDVVVQALVDLGVVPGVVASYRGTRVLWRLTADGAGWSVGTRSMRAHPPRGTVAVPIEGLSIPWGVRLLWRRDESDAGVQRVLDAFRTTRP